MTGKVRVYEVARQLGVPNKELIAKIKDLGMKVNNHMSSLAPDEVDRVKKALGQGEQPAPKVAKPAVRRKGKIVSGVVVRRRKKKDDAESAGEAVVSKSNGQSAAAVQSDDKADAPRAADAKPAAVQPAEPESTKVAAEAKPEPEPTKTKAAEPAPKQTPKKASVIVEGPPHVDLAGLPNISLPPTPEPEPESAPSTMQDVAESARSRFEKELERARERAEEREAHEASAEAPAEEEKTVEEQPSKPGRPVVGQVINLPNQRIRIAERKRSTTTKPNLRSRYSRPTQSRRSRDKHRRGKDKGQGKQTQITTPAEHKRVIRMEEMIAIPELAKSMAVKATEVLKKLWGMGMVGVNINASIDFDTAQILASEFGYEVQNVAFQEEAAFEQEEDKAEDLESRAPVVTVMGHVDHGKTSLLDAIRSAKVAAGEAGGITQHVAAYKVDAGAAYGDIVFLDTPGHEAFTEMRARGAQATDIVILVVASNDGVMPQTVEALNHAKDAKVQIIVAVNKCDLPDAEPEKVRQQLAEHALIPEEWGGDTMYVDVSAHTGEGLDKLLENISLVAEVSELRANPEKPAVGLVIEARLDRSRGPMASVLVQEGTLRQGDVVVAGNYYGKVRALLNHLGEQIDEAGPSTPVELLGLDGVPDAGEMLNVADDEKSAKQVVEHRRLQSRKKELATSAKVSLENIMERIQEGEMLELKVVLKADVQGSAEALKQALIKQSTDKVKVNVISAGVGGITESDVNLAKAGGAIVVGFHVRCAGKADKVAEREGVEINLYNIIYEAVEEVRQAMAGLLAPIRRESDIGQLEIRETYTIPKVGTVAGCMVTQGKILRKSPIRVIRDSVQIYEGKLSSLRRFKDDVSEVAQGYECGLMVAGFNDIEVGDIIEAYEIIEEKAEL